MTDSQRGTTGRVVRAGESYAGKQGLSYTPGVSAETVGAKVLWLGSVPVSVGGRTKAHVHEHHESAFSMVSGEEVELWTGDQLQHRDVAHPVEYLFIPAGVPHAAVNRSATPALFVGARSDPNEQESAIMRPKLDERVP
ncbi:MAG: cupin domain-containing protein [Chloroflexota bacterium]|nr:cupin domain-containing protein [Chloroflexota bacterium]